MSATDMAISTALGGLQALSGFYTELSLFFFFVLGYLIFHYDPSKRRLSLKLGGGKALSHAQRTCLKRFSHSIETADWATVLQSFGELEHVEPAQIEAAVRGCVVLGRHAEAASLVQHGLNIADGMVSCSHGNAILEAIAFADSKAFMDVHAALRDFSVATDAQTWELMLAAHAAHAELASRVPSLLKEALQSGICSASQAHGALIGGAIRRNHIESALMYGERMRNAGFGEELNSLYAVKLCKLLSSKARGVAARQGGKQSSCEHVLRLLGSLGVVPCIEAVDIALDYAGAHSDAGALRLVAAWTHSLAQTSRDLLMRGLAAVGDTDHAICLFDGYVAACNPCESSLAKLIETCADRRNVEFAEHVFVWATHRRETKCSLAIFTAMIKVYAHAREAQKNCELYEQMRAIGLEPDMVVYSALIRSAVACGRYELARELFAENKVPEVQNYMALMCASAREKNLQEALRVLHELESASAASQTLRVDTSAYNCALDACVSCNDLQAARSLFERMKAQGYVDIISYNTLLKGLALTQAWAQTESLLEEMRACCIQPNCVTYNSLINAAVKAENMSYVWRFVEDMGRQNVPVDEYTCSILTKVLRLTQNREDVDRALRLIDRAAAASQDDVFFSTLLDACIRLGDHARLKQILARLQRSRVSLSAHTAGVLIKAYGFTRQIDLAWQVWYDMADRWRLERTEATYGCMLEACVQCGSMDDALGVFRELQEKLPGRTQTGRLHTLLIKGFAQRKEMHRALQVYEDMKEQDVPASLVTFNVLIDACARVGDMVKASELFTEMVTLAVEPDLITYSTVIKGCCVQGDLDRAVQLFGTMQRKGIRPDAVLFNSILDGCAKRQMRTLTESVLGDMEAAGIAPSNITLSILVKLYGRCRDLPKAFDICEEIPKRFGFKLNAHVYTCLMTACITNGVGDLGLPRALAFFEEMKSLNCAADAKTFQTLVTGCLKHGDIRSAVAVVDDALKLYSASPRGAPFPLEQELLANVLFMAGRRGLTEELGAPLKSRLSCAGVQAVPATGNSMSQGMRAYRH